MRHGREIDEGAEQACSRSKFGRFDFPKGLFGRPGFADARPRNSATMLIVA
jgi:hypothetical protein